MTKFWETGSDLASTKFVVRIGFEATLHTGAAWSRSFSGAHNRGALKRFFAIDCGKHGGAKEMHLSEPMDREGNQVLNLYWRCQKGPLD